jgi:N-acetylmuramoyl-L-alanine amidase
MASTAAPSSSFETVPPTGSGPRASAVSVAIEPAPAATGAVAAMSQGQANRPPATVASNDPAKLLPPVASTPPSVTTATPPPAALPAPVKSLRDASGRPLRPLVIAIDPGHGGQDPGAIGLNGNREKIVTLAIARELARQINATPGYKAFLTRDTDVFLPLHQRTRLAKQAKADMFVSIHADAAENRAARGSSVYVLSTKGASSQRARWLADKENAADLIGGVKVEPGNTLASVLLDLTQSGNLRASEDAASQVLTGLGRIGPHHKSSVERANFAVLRTSDIPAMLVETAFISNPDEEQRLIDPVHQQRIARAVLDGVNGYFTRQPPPGTLLAARLEAEASTVASAGGAQAGSR